MTPPPAMEVSGPARRFGGLAAVNDVSLALHVGEMHAVIGPNGAGKSALTDLLSGELSPSSGTLRLHGAPIAGRPGASPAPGWNARSGAPTCCRP